jgi:CRISPR-associated exonuclease Cas4
MYSEEDLLPLSGLQHLAFCDRRWALIHLERQWKENRFTVEGELLHDKAHSAAVESRPGVLVRRTLPVHCFRLGLSGQTDVVEFLPAGPDEAGIEISQRKGLWRPYPVEYKRVRDRHGSTAYRLQLCAQALCLEEMLQTAVPRGAIFDGKAKRREEVSFDLPLRRRVEDLAAMMHRMRESLRTPRAVYEKKCENCSMEPVCLPRAQKGGSVARYLGRAVDVSLHGSAGRSGESP